MARKVAPASGRTTSAEILAGADPPVTLNLKLSFTDGQDSGHDDLVPASLRQRLFAQEAKLLSWIGRSRANQLAFVADPVSALAQAGIDLSAAETAALRRVRPAGEPQAMVPPGTTLASLGVQIATAAGARIRRDQRGRSSPRLRARK